MLRITLAAGCFLIVLPCQLQWTAANLSISEIEVAVNFHRQIRSNVALKKLQFPGASNMIDMEYDPILGKKAQKAANKCVKKHSIYHQTHGENFQFVRNCGTKRDVALNAALKSWYEQLKKCTTLKFDLPYPDTDICLEFTQMIWAKSEKFGCGINDCGRHYAIFCLYSPAGNNYDEMVYEIGEKCQNCDFNMSCNEDTGLCIPPKRITKKPLPLNRKEMTYAVQKHNMYRSKLARGLMTDFDGAAYPTAANMVKMDVSVAMQKNAQKASERCEKSADPSFRAAQNFYIGRLDVKSKQAVLGEVIKRWWSESEQCDGLNLYNEFDGTNSCSAHFTQMAWAKSGRIGCGMTLCETEEYSVFCFYMEKGNIEQQMVYEVGEVCSKCLPDQKCDYTSGLCVN